MGKAMTMVTMIMTKLKSDCLSSMDQGLDLCSEARVD